MQQQELKELVISALVLAFVFAYSRSGGIGNLGGLIIAFPIALIVVSLGFILHELGHRELARKFNCYAEYRLWKQGLFLALLVAFVSNGHFIFAAPGAVMIHARADLWGKTSGLSRQGLGLISVAGPAMNLILAGAFLLLNFVYPLIVFGTNVFYLGTFINIWLALFNLIPFPPFDGSKIFIWNRKIWIILFILTGILFLAL